MTTLLEKAKQRKPKYRRRLEEPEDELLELTLAYLNGEVNLTQFNHALDSKHNGNATHRIGSIIQRAVANKKINIIRL